MNAGIVSTLIMIACCLLNSGSSSAQTEHTYHIFSYEWPNGNTCQVSANNIGNTLEQNHDVDVLGVICKYDRFTERTSVVIKYTAEEPLTVTSTYTMQDTYDTKGTYATLAECEDGISDEKTTFTSMTGLTPLFAFCSHERLTQEKPWYVHIDGIGETESTPRRFTWPSKSLHGKKESDVDSVITSRLSALGFTTQHIVWRPSGTTGDVTVTGYEAVSEQGMDAWANDLVTIPGIEGCNSQVETLETQLKQTFGEKLIAIYCSSGYSSPSRFEVTLVHTKPAFIRTEFDAESFESIEDCERLRPQISQNYAAVYGDNFIGTACGRERYSLVSNGGIRVAIILNGL